MTFWRKTQGNLILYVSHQSGKKWKKKWESEKSEKQGRDTRKHMQSEDKK